MRYRHLGLGALFLLVCGFAVADRPITIYVVGDSTAAPKLVNKRPETGWGEQLQQYFDPDRVRVNNRAGTGGARAASSPRGGGGQSWMTCGPATTSSSSSRTTTSGRVAPTRTSRLLPSSVGISCGT